MLTVLIEEITAAYRWACAARAYVAAGQGRSRAGFGGAALLPCPCR